MRKDEENRIHMNFKKIRELQVEILKSLAVLSPIRLVPDDVLATFFEFWMLVHWIAEKSLADYDSLTFVATGGRSLSAIQEFGLLSSFTWSI